MGREPVDDGGGRNRRYGRLLDMPGPSPIPPELITGPSSLATPLWCDRAWTLPWRAAPDC